jgi:hypothetical protein
LPRQHGYRHAGFQPNRGNLKCAGRNLFAQTIRAATVSFKVSLKPCLVGESVDDQQQLLAGKAFKSSPTQPVNFGFVQETE